MLELIGVLFGAPQRRLVLNTISFHIDQIYNTKRRYLALMPAPDNQVFILRNQGDHWIRLSTSLKELHRFAFLTLQCRPVLNIPLNFTFIHCLIQSGVTWRKTTTFVAII